MSTSNLHQEMKKDYSVPEGEEGYFHILFVDKHINQAAKAITEKVFIQKYKPGEWYHVGPKPIEKKTGIRANIEEYGIKVTGHDEYSVLHDPTKPAPKKPGRKPASDNLKDE